MALPVLRVLEGEDVLHRDGLHQPAADIRWRGALPQSSPETSRAEPRHRIDAAEVRVDRNWGDPVRQTCRKRGPHMLYEAAELRQVVEGPGRRLKVPKDRKGRRPPRVGDGVVVI